MEPTSIQKKLWKAYGKVGKKLPTGTFKVYRPIEYGTDPIQQLYLRGEAQVALTIDDSFEQVQIGGVEVMETYIDPRVNDVITVDVGDILYDQLEERTYVIIDREPHLPIKSIRTPNRVTISRAGYADSVDGYGLVPINVATNLPVSIVAGGAASGSGVAPVADAGPGDRSWAMKFWMPNNSIQQGDVVLDEQGNRSEVYSVHWTHQGYSVTTVERAD